MFARNRESRQRDGQHRPGRRVTGFEFAGPPMIATSCLHRPTGSGRPHAHPTPFATNITPISIESPLHLHDYIHVNLPSPPKRIGVLGGAMSAPVFNSEPFSSRKEYFVDVPKGVYPGESFRLNIDGVGNGFLIICPDISVEGERIVYSHYPEVLHTFLRCIRSSFSEENMSNIETKEDNVTSIVETPRTRDNVTVIAYPAEGPLDEYHRVFLFLGNENVSQEREDFFVDCPFDIRSGDLFHAYVGNKQYTVHCPHITIPGERIVLTVLTPKRIKIK